MAPKTIPPEPANPVKEREPKDLGLTADYRQWISFEGCCTPATKPPVTPKLHDERQAGQQHSRALKAHLKTLQGTE